MFGAWPGVIRLRNRDPECQLWTDWFAHERQACQQSFSISRDWLVLAGTVLPRSARPQMLKPQKHVVNALLNMFFLLAVCLPDGTCVPDTPLETQPCAAPALLSLHQECSRARQCYSHYRVMQPFPSGWAPLLVLTLLQPSHLSSVKILVPQAQV